MDKYQLGGQNFKMLETNAIVHYQHSKHRNTSDCEGRDKKEKTKAPRIVNKDFDSINSADPDDRNYLAKKSLKGAKRPADVGVEGDRPLSKTRRLDDASETKRNNEGPSHKQNTATKKGEMLQLKSVCNKKETSKLGGKKQSNILNDKAIMSNTDLEDFKAKFDSELENSNLSTVATKPMTRSIKHTSHHRRTHSSSKSSASSHTLHRAQYNEHSKGDSTSKNMPSCLKVPSSTMHKNKSVKTSSTSRHESSSIKSKHLSTKRSDSKIMPQYVHSKSKTNCNNTENKLVEYSKHRHTSDSKDRDKKEKSKARHIVNKDFDFINNVDPDDRNYPAKKSLKGAKRPADVGDEGDRPLTKTRRLGNATKTKRNNEGPSHKQNTATKKGEMLQLKSVCNEKETSKLGGRNQSNVLNDKAIMSNTDLEEFKAKFDSELENSNLSSVATKPMTRSIKSTSHHRQKHSSSKSSASSHTFHRAHYNKPSKGDSTSNNVPSCLKVPPSTMHKNKSEKTSSTSRHESSSIKSKHLSTKRSDSKIMPQYGHSESKTNCNNTENKLVEYSKHRHTSDSKDRDKKEKTKARHIMNIDFDFINNVDPDDRNYPAKKSLKGEKRPADVGDEGDRPLSKTRRLDDASKTKRNNEGSSQKQNTVTKNGEMLQLKSVCNEKETSKLGGKNVDPVLSYLHSEIAQTPAENDQNNRKNTQRGRPAEENHRTIVDDREQKIQMRGTQTDVKRRTIVGHREQISAKSLGHVAGIIIIDHSETQEAELRATDADNEAIDNAVPKPSFSRVKGLQKRTATIVIIDLETTGLIQKDSAVCNSSQLAKLKDLGLERCSKDRLYRVAGSLHVHPRVARIISVQKYLIPHITQIAALEISSKKTFSRYVIPKLPINSKAVKLTGINYDGKSVYDALTIDKAICEFVDWLKQFENVVLVAHNGKRFDFRVLSFAVEMTKNRRGFLNSVTAFADSLGILKKKYPDLEGSFLATIFKGKYNAHNAIDDVAMLDKILTEADICKCQYLSYSYDAEYHFLQEPFERCKSQNLQDLKILVSKKVMSKDIAEKVAGSGLNLRHLKLIYQEKGEMGLRREFSRLNNLGKPRVTSRENVLSVVIPKLCALFSKNRTELSIITDP